MVPNTGICAAVEPPKWTWWPLPRRYLLSGLGFFGLVHLYFLRVNMSFAIVAMTKNYTVTHPNGTTTYESEFEWSSKERGLILGSFFWGYITTQILGGILAPMVGAGRLLCVGIFGTAVLTILTPITAQMGGLIPLVIVRTLEGVFEGVVFPALNELMSYWAPPLERTKLLTIWNSGNHIGTFLTMALCGIISQFMGWQWIFYLSGMTGVLWSAIWTWKVYEDPLKDPNITAEERDYITSSIGKLHRVKFTEAPWKSILTSVPIWAAIVAHCCQNSGLYTLLTQLPTFLNDVAGWRLDQMGLLAAVPYLVMAIVVFSGGQLADLLRSRFKISTTIVRKVFTSGCFLVQMTFLLLTAHVTYSIPATIGCLTVAVASGGLLSSNVNYLDLSPQFAALTMAVSNTFATLPGMVSPSITGYIVQNRLASEWLNVFYITSGVFLFGAIFYAIFGSGERQPWADNPGRSQKEEATEDGNVKEPSTVGSSTATLSTIVDAKFD